MAALHVGMAVGMAHGMGGEALRSVVLGWVIEPREDKLWTLLRRLAVCDMQVVCIWMGCRACRLRAAKGESGLEEMIVLDNVVRSSRSI